MHEYTRKETRENDENTYKQAIGKDTYRTDKAVVGYRAPFKERVTEKTIIGVIMKAKSRQDVILEFNSGGLFLSECNNYYTDLIKV